MMVGVPRPRPEAYLFITSGLDSKGNLREVRRTKVRRKVRRSCKGKRKRKEERKARQEKERKSVQPLFVTHVLSSVSSFSQPDVKE